MVLCRVSIRTAFTYLTVDTALIIPPPKNKYHKYRYYYFLNIKKIKKSPIKKSPNNLAISFLNGYCSWKLQK